MDVLMPQLGETVAEGKITAWFMSVGDKVQPGDNLFEIETDKATMEVPATAAGELQEIRVAVGAVAPVGAVLAVIADGSGAASAPRAPAQSSPAKVASASAAAAIAPTRADAGRPIKLDPFREVRTPERNFGPARLASGPRGTPLSPPRSG